MASARRLALCGFGCSTACRRLDALNSLACFRRLGGHSLLRHWLDGRSIRTQQSCHFFLGCALGACLAGRRSCRHHFCHNRRCRGRHSLLSRSPTRLRLCVFSFQRSQIHTLEHGFLGGFPALLAASAFRAARWGGKDWLTERFGHRRFFGRIVHSKPTVASVFAMRMLPVSNAIINIGLALSHVGDRAFLLGSLLGFLPQGIVAVIIGSGMATDVPWMGAAQIGVAGIVLLATFFWTARKHRKRR